MPRETSAIGREALISREAIKLKAYLDSVGVWTIGVGHTAGAGAPFPKAGMTITRAEALAIFARDLKKYENAVVQGLGPAIADKLTQNQFDALVSICYNIGTGWFTNKKKATFVKNIIAGDMVAAAANIMKFVKPPEVTTRRKAEQMQFQTPYDVSLPYGRSTDPKPIKAPAATVPTMAPPVSPKVNSVSLAGTLGTMFTKLTGRAPNVIDAKEFPPGFKGDPIVGQIQAELRRKGYTEVGKIDGFVGDDTNKALTLILTDNGESTSKPRSYDEDTLALVRTFPNRSVALERAVATTVDVQNAAPEVMAPVNNLVRIGLTTLGAGGLTGISEYIQQAKDTVDKAQETYGAVKPFIDLVTPILTFVANHPGLVFTAIGLVCLSIVALNTAAIVQMFRTKRIN